MMMMPSTTITWQSNLAVTVTVTVTVAVACLRILLSRTPGPQYSFLIFIPSSVQSSTGTALYAQKHIIIKEVT